MPRDIKLTWNNTAMGANWGFSSNDLATTDNLLTPVIVSLFTDARAEADDRLPAELDDDRRGWWGDAFSEYGDKVGSKLWLLERESTAGNAAVMAKEYALLALKWMVDEGIATSVDVSTDAQQVRGGAYLLAIQVLIRKPTGTTETYKFQQEWKAVQDGA